MTWTRGQVAGLVVAGMMVYYLVGVVAFPALLGPFGCKDYRGDQLEEYKPVAAFNISYDAESDSLTVTHEGGDSLAADFTRSVIIQVQAPNRTTNYTWNGSDGTYPISIGDSVTISSVEVPPGSPGGATVRVLWTGPDASPEEQDGPFYCPEAWSAPETTTIELEKRSF